MGRNSLQGKRILLGVTGSIAAYKAVDILRRLQDQGADVRVAMTKNAARFVSPLTFETLSRHPVPCAEFQEREQPGIGHIDITEGLDIALVAPATANVLGKVASGIADDTLTTALLALDCPLIMAPAMNDRMYGNPVVRENIAFLKDKGVLFVEPETGELACGTVGQGRLADADRILQALIGALPGGVLSGSTVLVTAGPTREPIDAVRFISNPSTGKMGFAIAAAAAARGASVVLIVGPTELEPPKTARIIKVKTAADMCRAVLEQVPSAEILIMAAAVSDFKPVQSSPKKIKKQDAPMSIDMERTEDILAMVARQPGRRIVVGFAAETDDLPANAEKKLKDKNLDLIVANDVLKEGAGFGTDTNSVTMIDRTGTRTEIPLLSKAEIASRIMDKVIELKKK